MAFLNQAATPQRHFLVLLQLVLVCLVFSAYLMLKSKEVCGLHYCRVCGIFVVSIVSSQTGIALVA